MYNKGILISDSAPLAYYLPYKLTGFYGCINIKNIPIELDVSRNRISNGIKQVNTNEKEHMENYFVLLRLFVFLTIKSTMVCV